MPAALQPLQWQRRHRLMMSRKKLGHKRGPCVPGLRETPVCHIRGCFQQSHDISITAVWEGQETWNLCLCAGPQALRQGEGHRSPPHRFNREVCQQRSALQQASHLTGGTPQPARTLMPAPGPQACEAHPAALAAASPAGLDARGGWRPVQSPCPRPHRCRGSLAWCPTGRARQWRLPYPCWVQPQHQPCGAPGLPCQQLPASQHCLCSTCSALGLRAPESAPGWQQPFYLTIDQVQPPRSLHASQRAPSQAVLPRCCRAGAAPAVGAPSGTQQGLYSRL